MTEIRAAREGYRRVYGVRKTWKELGRRGVEVGRDRVARLMRAGGLEGVRRGKKKRTTIPDEAALEQARDLLQRDFTATRPNEKWVADITYLRAWNGFGCLAFILDCYSRMIVGWQLATHLRTELVMDAPWMANGLRQPQSGLIAHTDRGSQYASLAYTDRLDQFRGRTLRRLERQRARQRDRRGLDRDLQDRTRRRAPFPQLRARRTRDTSLDQLLQHRASARTTRRHTARRARDDQSQERQHRNPANQLTEPPTNPGRFSV